MPNPSRLLALTATVALLVSGWQAVSATPAKAAPAGVSPEIERLTVPTKAAGRTTAGSAKPALSAPDVEEFSLFGVTWDSGPTPTLDYRVKVDGSWTGWEQVPIDDDHATGESGERPGSEPVFTSEASGIELRLKGSSAPKGLSVDLIDPGTSSADKSLPAGTVTGGAPTPRGPSIISRKSWGADEKLGEECDKPYGTTIRGAVIHHTAGVNNYSSAQSASIVRGIYAYHTESRGYCDIAYNFLVDRYGRIYEGRAGGTDLPVHGAHARDWNADTVGVSRMGDHTTSGPTTKAFDAAASIVAWKLDGNYRDPKGKVTLAGKRVNTIFTHGDVVNTNCPGPAMDKRMPEFRNLVAKKMGDWKTGKYQKWQSLGGESGWVGSPRRLEQKTYGNGSYTEFAKADIYGKNGKIHAVKGTIRTAYRNLGGAESKLGYPTSDEYKISGGARSNFERGTITWSSKTNKATVKYNS
ncbi:N-acetylmuramoyl-L-alanine amidase [Naumannella halotolerans]|uniref:N-acetylmuramoyl-L-alanine amidase n=1 Tax=Naumannella halotolerans TaxID=993414 RepID=UPI00370DCBFD